MRALLLSLALLGLCAAPASADPDQLPQTSDTPRRAPVQAQTQQAPVENTVQRRDPFVRSSDECGASRYAHLVGEEFATLEHAALPANTVVQGGHGLMTLEYTPGTLRVTVRGGRIAAIGCY